MLAVTYFNFDDPLGLLNYLTVIFMYSATTTFLETNHSFIGAGYVLLSLPFAYGVFRMLFSLVRKRKIAGKPVPKNQIANEDKVAVSKCQFMFGWLDDIAINGKRVTETIEVALQTYQAYHNSKYIANALVNQLYAVCIFINCWSTSLIYYVWEHRRGDAIMARFFIVLADVVLDFFGEWCYKGC
ncbi:TPA: hypothetical protein N0F65_007536 [Lagenidium giganteum]|uniref:XK-related protein n=1 Tax=Lagenidium giganteum TaxID=4803 RepID=A0AAV2ZNA7_9STRA|nr:TPA: hypothetical protein N0F65_007536 [Lagenidium giganteum]